VNGSDQDRASDIGLLGLSRPAGRLRFGSLAQIENRSQFDSRSLYPTNLVGQGKFSIRPGFGETAQAIKRAALE
jgi:hypothetical protein